MAYQVFQPAQIVALFEGSPSGLKEVLDSILDSSKNSVPQMRVYYEAQDFDSLRHKAHYLKSTFNYVVPDEFVILLKKIHTDAENKTNLDKLERDLHQVETDTATLISEIESFIKQKAL